MAHSGLVHGRGTHALDLPPKLQAVGKKPSQKSRFSRGPRRARACLRVTAGSAFDTVLHVRVDECAARAEVACNDDEGGPMNLRTSQVELEVERGVEFCHHRWLW